MNYRNNYNAGKAYGMGWRDSSRPKQGSEKCNTGNAVQAISIDALTYVDTAESVMQKIMEEKSGLTTSKIRNILAMVSEIYNDARRSRTKVLDEKMRSRIQYLRLHIAYEAGRDNDVRAFVQKAGILGILKDIGTDREKLRTFCHYMEALVAYHRYYGGREI